MRRKIPDSAMFRIRAYPAATVRTCLLCKFSNVVRCGTRPGFRGYGMVYGNKARGEMIQHYKAAHPQAYEALRIERDKAE